LGKINPKLLSPQFIFPYSMLLDANFHALPNLLPKVSQTSGQ